MRSSRWACRPEQQWPDMRSVSAALPADDQIDSPRLMLREGTVASGRLSAAGARAEATLRRGRPPRGPPLLPRSVAGIAPQSLLHLVGAVRVRHRPHGGL